MTSAFGEFLAVCATVFCFAVQLCAADSSTTAVVPPAGSGFKKDDPLITHIVPTEGADLAGSYFYIPAKTPTVWIYSIPAPDYRFVPPIKDAPTVYSYLWHNLAYITWRRQRDYDSPKMSLWKGTLPTNRRVSAKIIGKYTHTGSGNGEPPPWSTMSVNVELMGDTDRNGNENLDLNGYDVAEDKREDAENNIGMLVGVTEPKEKPNADDYIVLQEILPEDRPVGRVTLTTRDAAGDGAITLFDADGNKVTQTQDLWPIVGKTFYTKLWVKGVQPGPVVLTETYETTANGKTVQFKDVISIMVVKITLNITEGQPLEIIQQADHTIPVSAIVEPSNRILKWQIDASKFQNITDIKVKSNTSADISLYRERDPKLWLSWVDDATVILRVFDAEKPSIADSAPVLLRKFTRNNQTENGSNPVQITAERNRPKVGWELTNGPDVGNIILHSDLVEKDPLLVGAKGDPKGLATTYTIYYRSTSDVGQAESYKVSENFEFTGILDTSGTQKDPSQKAAAAGAAYRAFVNDEKVPLENEGVAAGAYESDPASLTLTLGTNSTLKVNFSPVKKDSFEADAESSGKFPIQVKESSHAPNSEFFLRYKIDLRTDVRLRSEGEWVLSGSAIIVSRVPKLPVIIFTPQY